MPTKQERKKAVVNKLETAEKRLLEIKDEMVALKAEMAKIMLDVANTANKAICDGVINIEEAVDSTSEIEKASDQNKECESDREKFPWLFDDVKYQEDPRHVYILMPVYKISLSVLRRNWATLTAMAQLLYGNFAEVKIVNKCPSHEINTLDELSAYQFEEYKYIIEADTFVCSGTYGIYDNEISEDDMCMRNNLIDNRRRMIAKRERSAVTDKHTRYIKKLPNSVLVDRDFLDTVHDHSDEENKGSSCHCCDCKDPQCPSPLDPCLD